MSEAVALILRFQITKHSEHSKRAYSYQVLILKIRNVLDH